jgi:hypothetical protein
MDRVKVIKRSIPCILGFTICPFLHSFIHSQPQLTHPERRLWVNLDTERCFRIIS